MRSFVALAGTSLMVASVTTLLLLPLQDEPPISLMSTCTSCHRNDGETAGLDGTLRAATPSDTCLLCHAQGGEHPESPRVLSRPGMGRGPIRGGGDFVFLTEANLNDAEGGAHQSIPGCTAGHNVYAPGHGLQVDPLLAIAPGGDFSSAELACTSCHDPHANEGFRRLRGKSSAPAVSTGTFELIADAPEAESMNLEELESPTNHTAYRSGMSEWCGNCHVGFHDARGRCLHPSGSPLGERIAAAYNAYRGTTDCVTFAASDARPCGSGSIVDAYLPEVPFESVEAMPDSAVGASAASVVHCLTCHRAHASSAPQAGRWDFALSRPALDGRVSGTYPLPSPYDENQRSLCNKCHQRDAYDALEPL